MWWLKFPAAATGNVIAGVGESEVPVRADGR